MFGVLAATFSEFDWGLLAAVLCLFFATAIFSIAETSLVATPVHRARALVEEKRIGAKAVLYLVERPREFFATILFLVFVCQTTGATLFGIVIEHSFHGIGVAIATGLEVFIVFVFVEAVPKSWALAYSDKAALLVAPLIAAVVRIAPVSYLALTIDSLARVITRSKDRETTVSESEIVALAEVAAEERVIQGQQSALIHSIIHFGETLAREVMTPRTEVLAAPASATVSEVLELALSRGFSRIPIFTESLDDAEGVALVKDLAALDRAGKGADPVGAHVRKLHFFPETKRVSDLLPQMQRDGIQMALLIDEYGAVTGLVTIEDLVEELVGEIVDEYDVAEPQFEMVSPDEVRLSGRMSVDAARELLKADFPDGDWDTLGGFLMARLGRVPEPGEGVRLDGFVVIADRVVGRKVSRVRIKRTGAGPIEPTN